MRVTAMCRPTAVAGNFLKNALYKLLDLAEELTRQVAFFTFAGDTAQARERATRQTAVARPASPARANASRPIAAAATAEGAVWKEF